MRCDNECFFGFVTLRIAHDGDEYIEYGREWVTSQLIQILMDYPGLDGWRNLTVLEISDFYGPLIPGLIEQQIEAQKRRDEN